jgi:hypothetical protein
MRIGLNIVRRTVEYAMENPKKTCFVSIPFGRKPRPDGLVQGFDALYHDAIRPALEEVGYVPRRADELGGSAIIHRAMGCRNEQRSHDR